ncbi:MAG: sulfatase-like hydrolase/transferase [Victivallales bacterium]|nr:sulfatase-like hydrolase/transferase [Victivallales bacterium]
MTNKPNLLVIMSDQHAANVIGCYGDEVVRTPNLDRLAAGGMLFDNAYCSYPLCTPSRAGMFTGRFPHEVAVNHNNVGIDPDFRSCELGHLLTRAGYECAYGGKWHLPEISMPQDNDHGFEVIAPIDDRALPEACAGFLHRKRSRPFFLVASFDNPHNICEWGNEMPLPWGGIGQPPPVEQCPELPENHGRNVDEPGAVAIHRHYYNTCTGIGTWQSDDEWRRLRWAYARITEKVDQQIGRLLDSLETAGLADDTLVILSSDHGDQDGAHMLAHKRVLYEESVNVPFIIAGPGVRRGIADDIHLINNSTDFFVTVCDYAAVEMPSEMHGRSLRPIIEGSSVSKWPEHIVSEVENEHLHKHQRGRMVRSRSFKYIAYERGRNREQLFDLEADPGEMHNLAKSPDFRDELQRHREFLREWCLKTRDTFGRHYACPDVPFMIPGDEYC